MSNGTSPGVTIQTSGVVVAKPKISPGVTVKPEGYVVTPSTTELIQQGVIPGAVLPSGVTIVAGGHVVTPSAEEMKAIEAQVIKEYPNLQPGEQVKVSFALPDEPLHKVSVTMPDKPPGAFYLDPAKLSEKNRTVAGVVIPEPIAWGLYQMGNLINFLAPPQPEASLFQDPAKFLYQATRTATLYTVPFAYLATNWGKLTDTEKGINAAIDVAFCLLLFGRPISRAVKNAINTGIGKVGATQTIRLTNNLRTAIASGNTNRIRVASLELENFGRAIESQGIRGGTNVAARAAHISNNAEFYARVRAPKMPIELERTLGQIGDSFYPYRPSRFRLYQPEPARAEPGVKVAPKKTAVVPISKEEAGRFGLSSRQVDDIFKRVGENRAAFLREGEAIKKASLARIFEDVNRQLAKARETGVPVSTKPRVTPEGYRVRFGKPEVPPKPGLGYKWNPRTKVWESIKPGYTFNVNTGKYIKTAARVRAEADAYHAAINKLRINPTLTPVTGKPTAKWHPFKSGELTKTRMQRLITEWAKMEANLAVRQMLAANLITSAIAVNAAAIARILAAASVQTRARAMTQLSPAVRTALQTNLAQATTTAQAQAQAMAQALTKAQALAQVATLTETLLILQTKIQIWTKLGLSTAVLTRLALQTKAAIKIATKTATKIKVDPIVKVVRKVTPTKPKPPSKWRPRPFPLLPPGDAFKRQLTPIQRAGAVCWRQGVVYKLIYPPYGKHNIINSRYPIPGVKIVSGAKSAYESIAKAKGREGALPPVIKRDMGIFDIRITTPKRGKPKIHFKRDIRQRTRTTPKLRAGVSGMRG